MERDFWLERWDTGRIAFHEPGGDQRLPARWAAVGAPAESRVLVPLCGKSLDMTRIARQGHPVLGVELSAVAARAFFEEGGLPFAIDEHGAFQAYRSNQTGIDVTILVGDFFDLDAAMMGPVQAVYDRAATIALPDDMRSRYAEHLTRLVVANTEVLLVSIEYDEDSMSGPPFSIPDTTVRALYERDFTVEVIDEVSGPEVAGRLRERGLQTMTERAYRLRRRSLSPRIDGR